MVNASRRSVLVLGGTGFVGRSLLSQLSESDNKVTIFSRKPRVGANTDGVDCAYGDIRSDITLAPVFDVIIHAATDASADLNSNSPLDMFLTCVEGMQSVVRFCEKHKTPPVLLFTSSGGVYGDLPSAQESFPENDRLSAPSYSVGSAYAEGKRAAEFILAEAGARGVCDARLARLFAFSGIHLPLDRHFAMGNFIRDAVRQQHIVINGDGSAIRSYLDQADMAEWLLASIEKGNSHSTYHVGSERAISIHELADLVASRYKLLTEIECSFEVKRRSSPLDGVSRYVPSTKFTRAELQVSEKIKLETSIDRMLLHHMNRLGNK